MLHASRSHRSAPQKFEEAVRQEAETLAAEAQVRAPGALGETVEIMDVSRGPHPAYAIGTSHPVGRHIEFGRAALRIFLADAAFLGALAGCQNRLRNVVLAALKGEKILISDW